MEQLIDTDAAAFLASARKHFPAAAIAYLTKEIEVHAAALGLACIAVALRESGTALVATASFDLITDDGPLQTFFRAPLRTIH